MKYAFVSLTRAYAREIVESWKYEEPYSIDDYANEAVHMLDPDAWGVGLSAVLDEEGSLVGEVSIEFFDENERHTDYAQYGDDVLMNAREPWIGFGLRPDLVGRGRGADFASSCADFAVERFNYRGETIRLGVARFNERAVKAYSRAGFSVFEQVTGKIAGREFACIYMRKQVWPAAPPGAVRGEIGAGF